MAYVRARVSDESFAGWRAFCREYGVTVSAMLEALGPALGQLAEEVAELESIVRRAREIDEERRRR